MPKWTIQDCKNHFKDGLKTVPAYKEQQLNDFYSWICLAYCEELRDLDMQDENYYEKFVQECKAELFSCQASTSAHQSATRPFIKNLGPPPGFAQIMTVSTQSNLVPHLAQSLNSTVYTAAVTGPPPGFAQLPPVTTQTNLLVPPIAQSLNFDVCSAAATGPLGVSSILAQPLTYAAVAAITPKKLVPNTSATQFHSKQVSKYNCLMYPQNHLVNYPNNVRPLNMNNNINNNHNDNRTQRFKKVPFHPSGKYCYNCQTTGHISTECLDEKRNSKERRNLLKAKIELFGATYFLENKKH